MSLHLETVGRGPRLVLLHGWGLHAGVWDEVVPRLAVQYQVTVVDLPGHGRSPLALPRFELQAVAHEVAHAIGEPAVWLGWSLGGMIATQVASDFPHWASGLLLVASSPRFVRAPDWQHAQAAEVLAQFAQGLEQDFRTTVQRFIAIQAFTSPHAKEEMRRFRNSVFSHGEPDPVALRGGLEILAGEDLRTMLGGLRCPVQLLYGSHDALAPAAAGRQLAAAYPLLGLEIIEGAGHCPFLTHVGPFVRTIERFMQRYA